MMFRVGQRVQSIEGRKICYHTYRVGTLDSNCVGIGSINLVHLELHMVFQLLMASTRFTNYVRIGKAFAFGY